MENICGVCFVQAELYVLKDFHVPPMCLKCTKSFNAKSTNRYHSHPPPTSLEQVNRIVASASEITTQPHPIIEHQNHEPHPEQDLHHIAAINSLASDQTNRSTDINSMPNVPTTSNSAAQMKVQQMDLINKLEESMLQTGDNELLFGNAAACTLCTKTFTRKSLLLAHLRNHSADRKFVCSFCTKAFTQAANLRNHERIHRNEKPFVCSECGKAFTQVTNLNNHRRLHTGERPFVCHEPNCGRAFAQVTNLNNHMKTHHKIQQYMCNQCPKKFTQVTTLNQHLLVHSGFRGFVCPECPDKSYKQQSHLNQHMKSHGVFFCGQCDQKFKLVSHLTQHMKTHADLKFKCNVCMGAFNQESLLRKHMQRHVEDGFISRLFACTADKCKQVFADREQLFMHVQMEHTKSEPNDQHTPSPTGAGCAKCHYDGCQQSFDSTDQLNAHLIVDHKKLYDDIETRSKMNLMFLEQIKHQMAEQYGTSFGAQNDIFAGVAAHFPHAGMPAHHFGPTHMGYGTKRTEDNVPSKRTVDGATPADHTRNDGSYCVCSICFNVYKNAKTLNRHMLRFHGFAQQ